MVMIDDMQLRKLAAKTQSAYLLHVRRLAAFLHRSPDTATSEDLRRFQLYMVEQGFTSTTLNVTITGLKFFFDVTAHHPELMARMHPVPVPRKLPEVLSRDEAARLIASTCSPKYRAALSVAYGAGLRANEVVALKVTDVDSGRMVLRVEQGKGHKDRYAMLSPALLDCLRIWWKTARAESKILHGGWLFPGTESHRSAQHATAEPRDPRGRRPGADRQARVDAHPAPQLRHPSAGTEGRHPSDSDPAWP